MIQSVNKFNNQKSNCGTEKKNVSDPIHLLKPLLLEVLDEIKDTKHQSNEERLNSKMHSIQRDLNEKIELIKPTLLEVLNELKENKKLIKQEALAPHSTPVDSIKPMLVGVLEEIKEGNRKTQKALKEIKYDKKESLRQLKDSIEEKKSETIPKRMVYPKLNEDLTEYESTREENVNTVESDESYASQKEFKSICKGSKKSHKENHHKDIVRKNKNKVKKRHIADPCSKYHSNLSKRKSQSKHDARSYRKSEKPSRNISPSKIFNATEILSSPMKEEMVKDVIKSITKQKMVSMVSELLADRFIHKLKHEKNKNETRRVDNPETNLLQIESTRDITKTVKYKTTTDKPVTVQRFEIFLG